VRDHVAAQVRAMLLAGAGGGNTGGGAAGASAAGDNSGVVACSMERRAGAEYDFCEPLLAGVLRSPRARAARLVIVALLFISPGKHAGPGGDIAEIIAAAQDERAASVAAGEPPRAVVVTRLLGESGAFADVIAGRLLEALPLLP
jgi:sirohydrochlorin ferrochelatase